jgi:hypothetical protein
MGFVIGPFSAASIALSNKFLMPERYARVVLSTEALGMATEGSSGPHRIVVVLGAVPNIDIRKVAGRALSEGRGLVLLPLGPAISPGQDALISEVVHLCWSWYDALRCSTARSVEVIEVGDEVIVAASERERRLFEAMLVSRLRPAEWPSPDPRRS